jgi:hypothetical protein
VHEADSLDLARTEDRIAALMGLGH